MPDRFGLPTKSEIKYARLEQAVSEWEEEKRKQEERGLTFKAPSLTKLAKQADMTTPTVYAFEKKNDPIWARIQELRSTHEKTLQRKSIEETRLDKNRKLEEENRILQGEIERITKAHNAMKLDRDHIQKKFDALMGHYNQQNIKPPKLTSIDGETGEVVEFPRNE